MDFATIGKLGTYVKQKNLMFAAKHKIRTGQTLVNGSGNLTISTSTFDKLREASKSSTNQAKQQKLARIKQKLRGGQKLTEEELGFLRVNDPKTYKKAKHADDAREELKAELKKAKSKSEAREAMTRALVKASAEAMAELAAFGQGGGGSDCAAMNFGSADTAQSSSGEVSAENTENQTLAEVNKSIQNSGEEATDKLSESNPANHDDDEKISVQKNSDAETTTPEDIMEKYLWTIRALQDEWEHFTNSDEYKNLPEHLSDELSTKKISRNLLKATAVYRKAMIDSLNIA